MSIRIVALALVALSLVYCQQVVITRYSIGSSGFSIIYNGTSHPSGLVLGMSQDKIVFFESGEIRSINLDGSGLQRIYCGKSPKINNAVGIDVDPVNRTVYFTVQGSTKIFSVPLDGNCATTATVFGDVSPFGFNNISAFTINYESLLWIGTRGGNDAFLVQSQLNNFTITPFVIGHHKSLADARDFAVNADFGQAIYYTSTNIWSLPGGSINPVVVYKETTKDKAPFGICLNAETYGTAFFTDADGIKEVAANGDVNLRFASPQGLRMYGFRGGYTGPEWPLFALGLQN